MSGAHLDPMVWVMIGMAVVIMLAAVGLFIYAVDREVSRDFEQWETFGRKPPRDDGAGSIGPLNNVGRLEWIIFS